MQEDIYSQFIRLTSLLVIMLTIRSITFAQNSYTPDPILRNALRKQAWTELKPLTPSKYRFVMGLVFKGDEYFNTYEEVSRQKGFPTYEIATIRTFFEVICEEVIRAKLFSDAET